MGQGLFRAKTRTAGHPGTVDTWTLWWAPGVEGRCWGEPSQGKERSLYAKTPPEGQTL